jgi:hypothetical protein
LVSPIIVFFSFLVRTFSPTYLEYDFSMTHFSCFNFNRRRSYDTIPSASPSSSQSLILALSASQFKWTALLYTAFGTESQHTLSNIRYLDISEKKNKTWQQVQKPYFEKKFTSIGTFPKHSWNCQYCVALIAYEMKRSNDDQSLEVFKRSIFYWWNICS